MSPKAKNGKEGQATELLGRLDRTIDELVRNVQRSVRWRDLAASAQDRQFEPTIRREIRAAIRACRPIVAESTGMAGLSGPTVAVGRTWQALARREASHAYLGAMYAFEILTGLLVSLSDGSSRDEPGDRRPGPLDHCLRALIKGAVENDPRSAAQIEDGMTCLVHVYPLSVLRAAHEQAKPLSESRRSSHAA